MYYMNFKLCRNDGGMFLSSDVEPTNVDWCPFSVITVYVISLSSGAVLIEFIQNQAAGLNINFTPDFQYKMWYLQCSPTLME